MSNEEYYIGKIISKDYPPEAARWCNENNATMEDYSETEFIIAEDIAPEPTQEEINNLTMTALDFINFLRSCGLSLADIKEYLADNEELDTQLSYCQNVYCGVVKAIMPIKYKGITITEEMVERAFKDKYGVQ